MPVTHRLLSLSAEVRAKYNSSGSSSGRSSSLISVTVPISGPVAEAQLNSSSSSGAAHMEENHVAGVDGQIMLLVEDSESIELIPSRPKCPRTTTAVQNSMLLCAAKKSPPVLNNDVSVHSNSEPVSQQLVENTCFSCSVHFDNNNKKDRNWTGCEKCPLWACYRKKCSNALLLHEETCDI